MGERFESTFKSSAAERERLLHIRKDSLAYDRALLRNFLKTNPYDSLPEEIKTRVDDTFRLLYIAMEPQHGGGFKRKSTRKMRKSKMRKSKRRNTMNKK